MNRTDADYMTTPVSVGEIPALSDAVLCDLLWPLCPVTGVEELQSRHKTGYSLVSLTMATDTNASPSETYAALANIRHTISKHQDTMVVVESVEDIRAAKRDGKLGINFHFQGTEAVGRNLANIGAYYQLGVRWMLMAYNFQNNVGTGCIEAQSNDIGLSAFGKDVIAEMNRVGMIVDCSHSGYRTTMDAMETSTQPCIFSHSNPRALFDHPRNIRDDQMKACVATGGIVGINGVGQFIGEPREVTLDTLIRNIDYVVNLVGAEHVAFGLDYMTPVHTQILYDSYNGDVGTKIGLGELPWGFFHPTQMPQLLNELLKRGYSSDAVRGIMGENFLRVASGIWK